ncbi:MAG TPA: hypothetical protein VNN79_04150, partial [Actinomycetota bacterium]|nr:hypothetical protein [Actinomycetota bacterium]
MNPSAGQLKETPSQVSATSQVVPGAAARQIVPGDDSRHVPTNPGRLQTPQPPLQALSQHTPLAQNPVAQSLFDVQPSPNAASYNLASRSTVVPFKPPAISTTLLASSVAVWPCDGGAGIAAVAVHVLVPLNRSADPSVAEPLFPPATSTLPFAGLDVDSAVALWPNRAEVIVPASDQLPVLAPGSKISAVASGVEPFFPPVIRIFPFEFGSTTAVCCSRGPEDSAFKVLKADCAGSKRSTDETVPLPPLPPTNRTLLLSC